MANAAGAERIGRERCCGRRPLYGIDVPKGGCVKANHYEGSRPWARLAQLVSI